MGDIKERGSKQRTTHTSILGLIAEHFVAKA